MILALALLGGVSSAWAGDFIDDASSIYVAGTETSATDDSGKKILSFTAGSSNDVELLFTFEGKSVKPGQIFGVLEYSAGGANYNKSRIMKLTLDGNDYEEKSAGSTMNFTVSGNTVVLCSFLQNPNDTEAKSLRKYYIDNVDEESFTLTGARVFAGVTASTNVTIRRVGIYTLGEILEMYPGLKTNNWQINDSYRLLNDASSLGINNSKTNNGTDNGLIETKKATITTVNGVKLWTKAVDFTKIPDNYRYYWCRFLQPAEAIHTDLFEGMSANATLMLSFGTGSNPHSVANLPTMHGKLIDFDRNMYNYTFVDGVNPTACSKVDVKGSQTANYATYSRVLKAGYNSCAMPFKKFSNTADIPAGLTFYKVASLTDGKVVYSKLSNSDLTSSNVFTEGTNWTPIIIHAETEGVYTFVGRDAITNWSGITYSAKTVGNSGGELFWVGSFVNEVPTAPYDATTNYGITSDGTRFAPMVAGTTKTTYYRAFLADSRSASARELMPLFMDSETTGIANLNLNVNDNFDANAPIYNLAGQRVGKNYKGVVIQNGKKFIQK